MSDRDDVESNLAELILILQTVYNDGDKFWVENKDWLLDDEGHEVYL